MKISVSDGYLKMRRKFNKINLFVFHKPGWKSVKYPFKNSHANAYYSLYKNAFSRFRRPWWPNYLKNNGLYVCSHQLTGGTPPPFWHLLTLCPSLLSLMVWKSIGFSWTTGNQHSQRSLTLSLFGITSPSIVLLWFMTGLLLTLISWCQKVGMMTSLRLWPTTNQLIGIQHEMTHWSTQHKAYLLSSQFFQLLYSSII